MISKGISILLTCCTLGLSQIKNAGTGVKMLASNVVTEIGESGFKSLAKKAVKQLVSGESKKMLVLIGNKLLI